MISLTVTGATVNMIKVLVCIMTVISGIWALVPDIFDVL